MTPGPERTREMRVIYVTAHLPFGADEPFIVPEIVELGHQGCAVTIVPVRPRGRVVHGDARDLLSQSVPVALLSARVLGSALAEVATRPAAVGRALLALRASRSLRVFLKNLAVFPKGLWLGRFARALGAEHLHAHWASTPATVAMVAAEVSGIAWSCTAHRWDIAEENLLRSKAERGCFLRAISEHGGEEIRALVGRPDWSPWILHLGVRLPPRPNTSGDRESPFRLLTAARFVEKKGHVYLLEAVGLLRERGVAARLELVGNGPLRDSLERRVGELALESEVLFRGALSHDELLGAMSAGSWDAAVLPSIVTGSGELEGIPVSLIEAMARGLPVIGTATGGIPELLQDGAGLLVPPRDPQAIADAVERIAHDDALRSALAAAGRKRVEEAFSVARVAAALLARFRECTDAAARDRR